MAEGWAQVGDGRLRVVYVFPAHLLTSKRFKGIGITSYGVYWKMYFELVEDAQKNPRRGCLVAGGGPAGLADLQRETGIARRRQMLAVVRDLFDRRLWAWREVEGRLYIHIENYAANQDRFSKRQVSNTATEGFQGVTSEKSPELRKAGSNPGVRQISNTASEGFQGVTSEKSPELRKAGHGGPLAKTGSDRGDTTEKRQRNDRETTDLRQTCDAATEGFQGVTSENSRDGLNNTKHLTVFSESNTNHSLGSDVEAPRPGGDGPPSSSGAPALSTTVDGTVARVRSSVPQSVIPPDDAHPMGNTGLNGAACSLGAVEGPREGGPSPPGRGASIWDDPERRRKLVLRILDDFGDHDWRAWWENAVDRFAGDCDPAAMDHLIATIKHFKERHLRGDIAIKTRPGQYLKWLVTKKAADLGIALGSRG